MLKLGKILILLNVAKKGLDDLTAQERTYRVGDMVYLINSSTKVGQSKKLKPIWKGPFVVIKVISSVLFRIKGRKVENVVHHDGLKLCQDRVVPMWARRLRHRILDLDATLPYEEVEADEAGVGPLFDTLDAEQFAEQFYCSDQPERLTQGDIGLFWCSRYATADKPG